MARPVYDCGNCLGPVENMDRRLCDSCRDEEARAEYLAVMALREEWAPRDGQAPVTAEEGAPIAEWREVPTMRVKTLSDAELLAEMEQHAEAGL